MPETLKIRDITFEIESNGSFAKAESLARQALVAAGIRIPEDGGSMCMHPIEDGSDIVEVIFSTLEMDVDNERAVEVVPGYFPVES